VITPKWDQQTYVQKANSLWRALGEGKRFNPLNLSPSVRSPRTIQVKRYPCGISVKLAFSVAALIGATIMLLDEVLAVGDYVFKEKRFALFERV